MRLFEHCSIGGISMTNRVVRSATATFLADDIGMVTEPVNDIYRELANGEIGLIIIEDTGVGEKTLEPRHLRINDDKYINGFSELVDDIHLHGGKAMLQLSHSGLLLKDNQWIDVRDGFDSNKITVSDIKEIVQMYGEAAYRAMKAGFDGVQIHAAHGYFISRFLSAYFNRRNDEYGGTLENRTRIILEILHSIKLFCGDDFPVFIKVNGADFIDDPRSVSIEEAKRIATIMDKAGIDAIEVSGGTSVGVHTPARNKIFNAEQEAYHLDLAIAIAEMVKAPVIAVGGFRSVEVIHSALAVDNIEAVSLSRPFIREPHLLKRWKSGDHAKASCRSCNACFHPEGAICVFHRKR